MAMKNEYDVVVVGAGPVGLTVARVTAAAGLRVLVLDKKREIGVPVRCAEGVGVEGAEEILNIKQTWISSAVDRARFHAPDGTWLEVKDDPNVQGYVLDRKVFEQDLAEDAGDKGAEIRLKSYVDGLLVDQRRVGGVSVKGDHSHYTVSARVVAGCDGVESRIGRWAGIDTTVELHDLEVCFQYLLAQVDIHQGRFDFYVGKEIVPGGYIWVFPKGNRKANVGLGISGEYAKEQSPRYFLDRFIQEKFPQAVPLTATASGVPCARQLKTLVADGLVLAGDAARQVNPLSGGGIVSGIKAAQMAGKVIADCIQQDDVSAKNLRAYEKQWDKSWGKVHRKFYKIKEVVCRLTDKDINAAATVLRSAAIKDLTVVKLFTATLKKHPKLLLDIALAFSGR